MAAFKRLSPDLENCTDGQNHRVICFRTVKTARKKITVKILRACGGCLGTRSR
jgi:hypothetical protein